MTNREWLSQKNDYELAEWIRKYQWSDCDFCGQLDCNGIESDLCCYDGLVIWLGQEHQEGE